MSEGHVINPEMGRYWYEREHDGKPPTPWEQLPSWEQDGILRRVVAVIERRHPVAEYTPGDAALLVGPQRPRSMFDVPIEMLKSAFPDVQWAKEEQSEASKSGFGARAVRAQPVNLEVFDVYDTLVFNNPSMRGVPMQRREHLFNNRNVGNVALTNMVIASQLPSDDSALVTGWRLRTDALLDDGNAVGLLLSNTFCMFDVGDRVAAVACALDLWQGHCGVHYRIPPRTGFGARIEFFGERDPERFMEALEGRRFQIAIHLTGWRLRSVH